MLSRWVISEEKARKGVKFRGERREWKQEFHPSVRTRSEGSKEGVKYTDV